MVGLLASKSKGFSQHNLYFAGLVEKVRTKVLQQLPFLLRSGFEEAGMGVLRDFDYLYGLVETNTLPRAPTTGRRSSGQTARTPRIGRSPRLPALSPRSGPLTNSLFGGL
jgi:hypothetical protein